MYIYIYVIYICIYICVCVYIHLQLNTYTHVRIHLYSVMYLDTCIDATCKIKTAMFSRYLQLLGCHIARDWPNRGDDSATLTS